MYLGIDFDNTIIDYSNVLHKYAVDMGFIPQDTLRNKQIIADLIRGSNRGIEKWTMLQGIVYGQHIDEAELVEGFEEFLNFCKRRSIGVTIISHKTEFSAAGRKINLRNAAYKWMENYDIFKRYGLEKRKVFFGETRKDKLKQIKLARCTHFIDDLEEVLLDRDFPDNVTRIHYSTGTAGSSDSRVISFGSWDEIRNYFKRLS